MFVGIILRYVNLDFELKNTDPCWGDTGLAPSSEDEMEGWRALKSASATGWEGYQGQLGDMGLKTGSEKKGAGHTAER